MSDTVTLIAGFQAKPGYEDRLRDELNAMIEPCEAEPGCIAYRPLVDPAAVGAMVIVEEWVDRDALEYHFTTPHFKHVAGVLEEILAERFTLRMLAPTPESAVEAA